MEKATVFNAGEEVQYSKQAIVSKTVIKNNAKNNAGNVSLFAFDKGEGISEHTAPFDALVQVVDGRAEIIINGASHFLETGQSIIMPSGIPHAVKAVERFKMILTMIKG